jgi:hypothetical protein
MTRKKISSFFYNNNELFKKNYILYMRRNNKLYNIKNLRAIFNIQFNLEKKVILILILSFLYSNIFDMVTAILICTAIKSILATPRL